MVHLPHIGQPLQEPTFRSHRSQNHLGVVAVTLGCAIWCCELLKFGGMITQLTWTSVSLGHPPKTYRFNLSTVASSISPIGKMPKIINSAPYENRWKKPRRFCHGIPRDHHVPRHPWRQIVRRCHWREALRAAWADCNLQTSKNQKRRSLQNNLRLFKMVMISSCSKISI